MINAAATSRHTDARWAVGHPEKVVDFGWRALKETTEAAKALIHAYQGGRPSTRTSRAAPTAGARR